MAINFEAANMAGYNNPKIEVFKAALAEDGKTLAQYPAKSAIIAALNRGSLPIILMTMAGADVGYVFHLYSGVSSEEGDIIQFCVASSLLGDYAIIYPPDSGTPMFQSSV